MTALSIFDRPSRQNSVRLYGFENTMNNLDIMNIRRNLQKFQQPQNMHSSQAYKDHL